LEFEQLGVGRHNCVKTHESIDTIDESNFAYQWMLIALLVIGLAGSHPR